MFETYPMSGQNYSGGSGSAAITHSAPMPSDPSVNGTAEVLSSTVAGLTNRLANILERLQGRGAETKPCGPPNGRPPSILGLLGLSNEVAGKGHELLTQIEKNLFG